MQKKERVGQVAFQTHCVTFGRGHQQLITRRLMSYFWETETDIVSREGLVLYKVLNSLISQVHLRASRWYFRREAECSVETL